MKYFIKFVLASLVITFAVSCTTTKELDLNSLDEKEFNFEYLRVTIANDAEAKGLIFINEKMIDILNQLKLDNESNRGVIILDQVFVDSVINKSIEVETVTQEFGDTVLYNYVWHDKTGYDQGCGILLELVVIENGTLPTTMILNKVDPDNPERKISKSFPIKISLLN